MKCPVKIILSVMCGAYFYAFGQTQTITGRVIDSVTSTPIPNATTWPASYAQIPINTGKNYADEQHGSGGTPLFNYGYGLHYP